MGFDNTVTVVGNVTRDPELRFTQGGLAVANFGVAWNKKKNDGEDEVSFFDVTCFRQLAENVADSISKGARVVIYGTLTQRSWENQQGERRSKIEILADDVARASSGRQLRSPAMSSEAALRVAPTKRWGRC